MLNRLAAALAAIVFSATGIAADVPVPPPKPASPFVELVEGCSGFHLGDGYIATAGHCITKLAGHVIRLSDGREVTGNLALYSTESGYDDLAVIRVAGLGNIGAVHLRCESTPAVGDDVHMTGYPAVYGLATVWGRVAAAARPVPPWRRVIPLNIAAFGGFSGSAVLDRSERVVGVLVGMMSSQNNLAFMVPATRLCELVGESQA